MYMYVYTYIITCIHIYIYIYTHREETGDGQHGGWLRSHGEAPTCEAFTRLCERPVLPPQV